MNPVTPIRARGFLLNKDCEVIRKMADEKTSSKKTGFQKIIITGLISLVVGVGSGLLINYFTEKKPKLIFDITTQETFPGEKNNIGIFALRIANDGKREIEQLLCSLKFPNGKISERKITGIPESTLEAINSTSDIEISVPFLNPGEQFSIQVLLSEVKQPLERPKIELRGKGILGREAEAKNTSKNPYEFTLPLIISVIATLISIFISARYFLKTRIMERIGEIEEEDGLEKHGADQRDVIAFVLDTQGLSDDAKDIRNSTRELTYWATSDYLRNKWIQEANNEKICMGIRSLEFLINYASISDESRRIIFINMAKLALVINDHESAKKYLQIAREKKIPYLEARISADPDLKKAVLA